ncbi:MAG TPA: ferredoxin [Phycisphaerae bacterium]|nr:ferredoxin [Phycisphaerae bacterium]HOJ73894.1 ferredoxin [Phycisphaerae bacterium]HOM50835.1 ferredoxin [Phycisphaerae bacterium]HON67971.1 ferredoxin [Phycisphaerae bacterium]HOQ86775.1 ferredoxin [Phycisphaerae bacterium]
MANEQILKVWIEPGCIVCDACQTTCPEVFEVQAESCVIRPEALVAEFLRDKTDAIRLAAEECPVEVIRFETGPAQG